MADNTWHRTLCGIGVSEWDGKGGDPAPRDCGACADAPQPAPPAQPDPAALRALRALLRLPGLLRGQPVASDRRGERTMTTQTHVCSVAGCPQPVTLMTSLNGNPLRAYCATHPPVVYTQAAPLGLPPTRREDRMLDCNRVIDLDTAATQLERDGCLGLAGDVRCAKRHLAALEAVAAAARAHYDLVTLDRRDWGDLHDALAALDALKQGRTDG